jgi:DNA-binding MarR family transcriptional regulator
MTPNNTVSQQQQTILHLLYRASQSAEDLLANELNSVGLTPRQYTVLDAAARLSAASQTALVSVTGIDRSTLADIVRRLVEAGLLERERMASDARMYAVRLTEDGRTLLSRLTPVVAGAADKILAQVPAVDRESFQRALAAIAESLGPVASARVSERAKSLKLAQPLAPANDGKTACGEGGSAQTGVAASPQID